MKQRGLSARSIRDAVRRERWANAFEEAKAQCLPEAAGEHPFRRWESWTVRVRAADAVK